MQLRDSSILLWTSWSFPPLESVQDQRYTKDSMTSTWLLGTFGTNIVDGFMSQEV